MEKIKVLLFAANPRGTSPLDLPREFREIDEEVGRGPFRDAVELILVPGTRPVDLLRKLNENQPQVVHFSSHGSPDEIILESGEEEAEASEPCGPSVRSADERDMKKVGPDEVASEGFGHGQAQVVSKSALVNVLRSCNEGNLRLVVLNACATRPQAEALTEVVDCVVSMNRTITDRAAIKFAASFYGALAFGRSVRKAFLQGVARLSAEGIAETETPELLVRAGVDASQVVLVGSATSKVSAPAAEAPVHRAVSAERRVRGAGRGPDAAPCQPVGAGFGSGRHPTGGPDRHGRHRQDPACRGVCLPSRGRLPRWRLLDRRGRASG
ncbi:MAG: CHAT domain-containing protein [Isosphaerales bacterium]